MSNTEASRREGTPTNGEFCPDTLVRQRRAEALASLNSDLKAYQSSSTERRSAEFLIGYDLIHGMVGDREAEVKCALTEFRQNAKIAHKNIHGLSDASCYRRMEWVRRIIQSRAGLDRCVTIPYLRDNLSLLLLVNRDEMKRIAQDCGDEATFRNAFPIPGESEVAESKSTVKDNLEVPDPTPENIRGQLDRVGRPTAILGYMLKCARRNNGSFPAETLSRLRYCSRAAGQVKREADKILRADETTQSGLFH